MNSTFFYSLTDDANKSSGYSSSLWLWKLAANSSSADHSPLQPSISHIEEGWGQKQRQILLRLFGGQNLNSIVSSKLTEAKQLARQEIEQVLPPNRRDDLCLCFSLHPSSMVRLYMNYWIWSADELLFSISTWMTVFRM